MYDSNKEEFLLSLNNWNSLTQSCGSWTIEVLYQIALVNNVIYFPSRYAYAYMLIKTA